MRQPTCSASLILLTLAIIGCGTGKVSGPGDGEFSIDNYPTLVNATPVAITGTKPSGHAVQVDGAERIQADSKTTWSLGLDLAEGENSFLFEPVDPSGQAGTGETVTITMDSIPPSVISREPDADASDVPLNAIVNVVFSEPVDCSTITSSVFSIVGVNASLSCTAGNPNVRLTPDANLDPQTEYTVLLLSDVEDLAGNRMAADVNWKFTTGTQTAAVCGDNNPEGNEDCDDGKNGDPCDGCLDDCTAHTNFCGDNYPCGTEECDDGNTNPGDGCSATCTNETNPVCGDSIPQTGEQCDDNNNDPNDGCSPTCFIECLVPTPVLNPVVTPTTVNRQVLTGTKAADTAVLINDVVVVPRNNSTTWDAQVMLASGTNSFKIEARDGTGRLSCPENLDIVYTVPSAVDTSGQLKVELEVQSVWRMIGDEFRVGSRDRTIIDAFAVQIWIEGPLTVIDDKGTADPRDDDWEPCYYNAANYQRKYTRYVKTLKRHVYQGCLDINPPNLCYGYWWEPNYWAPNWFAALTEFGQWSAAPTPSGQRIPTDQDRRDPQGQTWRYSGSGPCPIIHFRNVNGFCQPRMNQPPVIDGITEATIGPKHDGWNPPHPATLGSGPNGVGALVGEWTDQRVYTWNLRDTTTNPVREGAYLVSITVLLDRALPANIHWPDFVASDLETCWDDPNHVDLGMHRAEGIIVIDSTTPQTVYWLEKGAAETVDACSSPNPNIWCDGHIDFTIMQDYSAAWATPDPPCSLLGDPVKYLKIPAGWPGPVKVQYCPNAACP